MGTHPPRPIHTEPPHVDHFTTPPPRPIRPTRHIFHPRPTRRPHGKGLIMPPCIRALRSVNTRMLGAFRPRCTKEGLYQRKQCHGSTGYCWCVNPHSGGQIAGTKRRGRVNCSYRRNRPNFRPRLMTAPLIRLPRATIRPHFTVHRIFTTIEETMTPHEDNFYQSPTIDLDLTGVAIIIIRIMAMSAKIDLDVTDT